MPIQPFIEHSKNPNLDSQSRTYLLFLWTILILTLVLNGYLKQYYKRTDRLKPHAVGGLNQSHKTSSNILITGRYAVGAKTVYSKMGKGVGRKLTGDLIQQLENIVKNNADRVALVPLIAELGGQAKAGKYLDDLMGLEDLSPELKDELVLYHKIYNQGPDELDRFERERLIERRQWLGKLALAFDLPAGDPVRREILKPAVRTFIASFSFVGLIVLIGLVGLVLLIVAMVMRGKGRLASGLVPLQPSESGRVVVLLETAVVFFMVILFFNIMGRYIAGIYFWCLYLSMIVFTFYFPRLRGMGVESVKTAFGWYSGKGVLKEVGSGLVGYLTGLPLIICGCLTTFIIMKYTGAQPVHPIVHQFRDAGVIKLLWLFTLACILAPLIEETLFRGLFYQYLRFRNPVFKSALITGLLFAVVHPQGYAAIPALGMIGAVLALIREWRGSLIAPVIAHGLNNFIITLLLILTLAGR